MTEDMGQRTPSKAERGQLSVEVSDLVSCWTQRLSGAEEDHLGGDDMTPEQIKGARMARLPVAEMVKEFADLAMVRDLRGALQLGATFAEIGEALGISRQAAEQRFGYLLAGMRVAVVISRRDRVHNDDADARGRYGEVGGTEQYDSDRGAWPIGKTIREQARYAIVAVDGTVRRVYPIDPTGWNRAAPGKWEFTAIGKRQCTPEEIEAAYAAGELPLRPGDACPTRAGGAYRPHWF